MSLSHSPSIVTQNIQLYLDPKNIRSYPGNGSIVYNPINYTNNFTLVNGVLYSGGSFILDGINNYIATGYSGIYNNISFSIWCRTSHPSKYFFIINKGGLTAQPDLNNGITIFSPNWSTGTVQVFLNNSTGTHLSCPINYNIRDGQWHNICVTYEYDGVNSIVKSYLDGNLYNTSTRNQDKTNFFNLSSSYNIGNGPGGSYFSGDISTHMIYSSTLSLSEIQQNYHALKGRYS